MKKLMFAMAAVAAGVAFADEAIVSANVVGYTSATTNAPSYTFTCPFVNVANSGNFTLGQVTPEGIGEDDTIQLLDPNDAHTRKQAQYYEGTGWYDGDTYESLNDLALTPGTAFLANVAEGTEIKWTFAGQVMAAGVDGKITIDVAGQASPFIGNPLPCTIKLGQVTPVGLGEDDTIQFLDAGDAHTCLQAQYYEGTGWYDGDTYDSLTERPLLPGEAFLGNIDTENSPSVSFKFPSAL